LAAMYFFGLSGIDQRLGMAITQIDGPDGK